jgi:5-oxoprolinase (ATP-hydrolysing)
LQLIDEYGLDVVLSYMGHIQQTAESSVRSLMKNFASQSAGDKNDNSVVFRAQEFMDDGSNIDLTVTVDPYTVCVFFSFKIQIINYVCR